jgi:hypothetical protein
MKPQNSQNSIEIQSRLMKHMAKNVAQSFIDTLRLLLLSALPFKQPFEACPNPFREAVVYSCFLMT